MRQQTVAADFGLAKRWRSSQAMHRTAEPFCTPSIATSLLPRPLSTHLVQGCERAACRGRRHEVARVVVHERLDPGCKLHCTCRPRQYTVNCCPQQLSRVSGHQPPHAVGHHARGGGGKALLQQHTVLTAGKSSQMASRSRGRVSSNTSRASRLPQTNASCSSCVFQCCCACCLAHNTVPCTNTTRKDTIHLSLCLTCGWPV